MEKRDLLINAIIGDEVVSTLKNRKPWYIRGAILILFVCIPLIFLFYMDDNDASGKKKADDAAMPNPEQEENDIRNKDFQSINATLTKEINRLLKKISALTTEMDEIKLNKAKSDIAAKRSISKKKTIREKTLAIMKHSMEAEKGRMLNRLKKLENDKLETEIEIQEVVKLLRQHEKNLGLSHKKIAKLEEMLRGKGAELQSIRKSSAAPPVKSDAGTAEDEEKEKITAELKRLKNELNREKTIGHYNIGALSGDLGRYDDAISHYMKAIEIDSNLAEAYYNMGVIFDVHLDKKNVALNHFRKYIEIRPYASDVEKVKRWIEEIELETGE